MQPRFVGRLGVADVVTVVNAAVGFIAAALATVDPALAARLVLFGAIADGLDGVLARKFGSTPVGEYLDSLADVASFCVAPAMLVFAIARRTWGIDSALGLLAVVLAGLFVGMGVVRLGLYTAYDLGDAQTEGVQTTLAATVLAAAYLAGVTTPLVFVGATAAFVYLMVAPLSYPELHARDALWMGVVQAGAILVPTAVSRLFPRALLVAALCYLIFGPWLYWRSADAAEERLEGKRS